MELQFKGNDIRTFFPFMFTMENLKEAILREIKAADGPADARAVARKLLASDDSLRCSGGWMNSTMHEMMQVAGEIFVFALDELIKENKVDFSEESKIVKLK